MKNNQIDLRAIGARIKQLRQAQGKTQEIFADENYISTSYLALLETGRRTASIDVLVQIAANCHVTIDYLLLGKEDLQATALQQRFGQLCRQYPEHQIENALRLIECYLNLK